jgi:hypothetical protein
MALKYHEKRSCKESFSWYLIGYSMRETTLALRAKLVEAVEVE